MQNPPGSIGKRNGPSGGKLLRKPRAPLQPFPPPAPPTRPTAPFTKSINSDVSAQFTNYTFIDPGRASPHPSRASPHPSRAITISPPPPSESFSRFSEHTHYGRSMKVRMPRTRLDDKKYILDQIYRDKTSLGTYVEGNPLVKPFRPRGPEPLPARPWKQHPQLLQGLIAEEDDEYRYIEVPQFTLQDFLIQVSENAHMPILRVQEVMLSRHNYKKIQKLLAEQCLPKQTEVNLMEFTPPDEIPHMTPRVPQKQLLIEMAALVKEQMSMVMQTEMKPVIRPLPKYSPSYDPDMAAPHTEIVLYEDAELQRREEMLKLARQESELPARDGIFQASTAKYFQGAGRSNSPFSSAQEGIITPSELAVLDSLMAGGKALSLKAHFITQLPDIEPLSRTITYLNLSFNDLRQVPLEIFEISQLTVLKLRDNPITEIPPEVCRLKNLVVLVFSFCLVSTLPIGLFSLKKLEQLDFAYNKVSFIPNEIKYLKKLKEMNFEGNQIQAMPTGALRLRHLKYLNIRNNYMHPLFWKDSSKNEPQRLTDLAALGFTQSQLELRYPDLPDYVQVILKNRVKCDCCSGPLYGVGLRVVRPVSKIFNVKNLPFLFCCCSTYCLQLFMHNSESLMEMLYGVEKKRNQEGQEEEEEEE